MRFQEADSRASLSKAIGPALGADVVDVESLAGGDINEAFNVTLSDGRRVFAKANIGAPKDMFETEARGLAWLREASALRVPEVLAVLAGEGGLPPMLVLEHIETGPKKKDFDEALGRGLAALHRFGAPEFGLPYNNFIGSLPQSNKSQAKWPDFYREQRLEPQLHRAVKAGRASAEMRAGFTKLFQVLEEKCGPDEPPSRLHGDLWGGNLLCDARGKPCLVDPAVYGGHREIDLAMMRLFGGFGERAFAAYQEVWPLAEGHEERVGLYQLYPLLVHVNLFGGSYGASVEGALRRLV